MLLLKTLFLPIIFALVTASQTPNDDNITEESSWRQSYRLVLECSQKPSMLVCLKMKAVKFLDRALTHENSLPLTEYLTFTRDADAEDDVKEAVTEEELEASLPRSLDEQSGLLDQMLEEKMEAFFSKRSLQLTLPMNTAEGRGKKYKYGAMVLVGLGMAGMVAQLMMGKIALIAGKALLVAKVALVLSAVVGLKKLFSKGDGGGGGEHVVYAQGGDHGGGGWSHRSLPNNDVDAHDMAYNSYAVTP